MANSDRQAKLLSEDLCASFFVDKADRGISKVGWVMRDMRLRQRWQDKATYALQHIISWSPNERDLNTFRLPHSLFFLYPFLRPLRLGWDYGAGLFKDIVKR